MSMDERKKHGWAFWATVALIALPIGYVLSFGPACWIAAVPNAEWGGVPNRGMMIYWPLGWAWTTIGPCLEWWAAAFVPAGSAVLLPTSSTGDQWDIVAAAD